MILCARDPASRPSGPTNQALAVQKLEDAEGAAEEVRRNWNLGLDPIASFVSMLEDHSIQVVEIDADDRFDGISAIASDKAGRRLGAARVTRCHH